MPHNTKEKKSAYNKQYQERNKEKLAIQKHEYYQMDRQYWLERAKSYSKEHKEEKAEYDKQYRDNNKKSIRQKRTVYNKTLKGKTAKFMGSRRRRARKANIPGSYTIKELNNMYCIQKGLCYYGCGKSIMIKNHIDHKIPISRKGSTNYILNLCLSCPFCNISKGSKTEEEFYENM